MVSVVNVIHFRQFDLGATMLPELQYLPSAIPASSPGALDHPAAGFRPGSPGEIHQPRLHR
jgi:hypothetical protein